jgi:diguanylate cyclase (GGDEF)-like protein
VRRFGLRLLPGGLLLLAASLLVSFPDLREGARPVVPVAAYVVTAVGILLGLRFGNVPVVLCLIVLALADQAVRMAPRGAVTVALLVSLNLAALAWTSDRGARRSQVHLWAPIIAAQALGGALLLRPKAARAAHALWRPLLEPAQSLWPALGQFADLAFAVAFVLALGRYVLRPRATEAGILWALVAAFLALGVRDERLVATLYLATGGLILIVALVETSYAMAFGDELTGLPARRALNSLLSTVAPPYAVGMIDIDHFKKFNDTYGHQTGDQLLRKVATTLAEVTGGGRLFRYGGEEFAVVFPGLSTDEASPHLETLREAIAAMPFIVRGPDRRRRRRWRPWSGRGRVSVTVSIGAADCTGARPTPADVVRAADEALYRAKHAGRNRLAT